MKTSELIKLLKRNRMKIYRHGANHDVWYSPVTGKYFEVGRHSKEIPTGTLRSILKTPAFNYERRTLMSKYSYPAIFTPEENGMYSVHFPDVQGCYTCGDNLIDAIEMAQDALALMLSTYEIEGLKISDPSNIKDIIIKENEFVSLIICDTSEYRKKYNKRAVKKTLTIPEWLNEAASAVGLNFSQVLQEALIQKLNL